MSDKPILFSGAMVRSILSGRKTQTRRVLKPQPVPLRLEDKTECEVSLLHVGGAPRPRITLGRVITGQAVRWSVGDRLWVRERCLTITGGTYRGVKYVADGHNSGHWNSASEGGQWDVKSRPSIHMPRWASRITLDVTAVRVERVQDIAEADAVAEGAPQGFLDEDGKFYQSECGTFYAGFAGLWDHINGAGSWDANPWVAVIEFRRAPDIVHHQDPTA